MQRIDNCDEERFLKAAVYGRSGTGKTSLGVTCPSPIILASERQCILSVKQAAKRLGLKEAPPTLHMESVEDYRRVIKAMHGNRAEPFRIKSREGDVLYEQDVWPQTCVIDSLTDAGRIISEEIQEMSPPKPGKDGLPTQPMRYWGVLIDKMTNLIQEFRNVPMNVLFLCLVDDRDVGEGEQQVRMVTPSLPVKRLPDTLAAACNLMGYQYRTETREKRDGKDVVVTSFATMFQGPEHFLLKQCAPLRRVEKSNFAMWHKAIFDHVEPEGEMPAASFESVAAHITTESQTEEKKEDAQTESE